MLGRVVGVVNDAVMMTLTFTCLKSLIEAVLGCDASRRPLILVDPGSIWPISRVVCNMP